MCMYVCIYICVYVCMGVCMYVICILYVHAGMYVYIYAHTCLMYMPKEFLLIFSVS